ncbi:hypothetical protein HDU93_004063 [Gonapodya sp. JEL0774]|nr:hypothetical protein HDU93_004063 [Gonapodya sp. JEL0774]
MRHRYNQPRYEQFSSPYGQIDPSGVSQHGTPDARRRTSSDSTAYRPVTEYSNTHYYPPGEESRGEPRNANEHHRDIGSTDLTTLNSNSDTFQTRAPVPSDGEWSLLIESKRAGEWTDVTVDMTLDQIQRTIDTWFLIKSDPESVENFSKAVLETLLALNPAYATYFPEYHIPALVIMDGVTQEATTMRRSAEDRKDVIAELIWLGAKHARWWKIGEGDFRNVVIAVLHVLSNHSEWAPGGAKDIIAWRAILCEMITVMCRGAKSDVKEIAAVKARIQAMKAKGNASKAFNPSGSKHKGDKRFMQSCKVQ